MIASLKAKITPDLSYRSNRAECMDDPECDREMLYRTLRSFERINRWMTRTQQLFGRMLDTYISKESPRSLTIADIGGGGGDVCRWLWNFCSARGIEPRLFCIDSDSRVAEYAQKRCSGYPGISVLCMDAHAIATIDEPIDFIIANHFLHHIPDEQIPDLLRKIFMVTRKGFFINDLRRSRQAYAGYLLLAGLFFRKGFTFTDGLISIRRGFTRSEITSYLERAGIMEYVSVQEVFPYRIIMSALKD